jgi:serine/threonine protein kinase
MSEKRSEPDAVVAVGDTVPGVGTDLSPGSVVGEYRIKGVLGRGGMGVVYAAIQPVIEKKVAIKVLAAQFSSAPDLVRRFIDEARAVNRIGHENIIDIFSFGQIPDGRQYFVMEYLEGATLAERLERGALPREQIPTLLLQICDALQAAHAKKIVHRDLKPENIWVGASTRGFPRVRLLDFGIAKLLDTGDRMVTDVGAVMGTPNFMSPEQCNGRGVDHRTDLYAMGVIMYRLFSGRLPITGDTYAQILAKQIMETPVAPSTLAPMPPSLERLIMRCLDKEPAGRPQSAAEIANELTAIFPAQLAADPTTPPFGSLSEAMVVAMASSPPTGEPATAAAPPRHRRAALIGIGIGLALAITVGVALLGRTATTPGAQIPSAGEQRATPVPAPPPLAHETAPTAPVAAEKAPLAGPSTATPTAVTTPSPTSPAVVPTPRRKPTRELKPASESEKPPSSRATRNGLLTDNPFK